MCTYDWQYDVELDFSSYTSEAPDTSHGVLVGFVLLGIQFLMLSVL